MNRFHFVFASLLISAIAAPAQVKVVTTSPGLKDITEQVGGEHVSVDVIMRGPENIHNVIPKPSFVMKLRKADLFVQLGLDAEPWVPNLLRSARRERLLPATEVVPGDVLLWVSVYAAAYVAIVLGLGLAAFRSRDFQ